MTALAKMQPEHAKQLYDAAAELGEPEALFRVGRVKESAARGYREALAAIGQNGSSGESRPCAFDGQAGSVRQAADTGMPKVVRLRDVAARQADGANWLRRAAEKGHARAMTETALRSKDATDRKRWFEAAAKAGDAGRHVPLGKLPAIANGSASRPTKVMRRPWLR